MTQIGKVAADVSSRIALPWLPKHNGNGVGVLHVGCSSRLEQSPQKLQSILLTFVTRVRPLRQAGASAGKTLGFQSPSSGLPPTTASLSPSLYSRICAVFA